MPHSAFPCVSRAGSVVKCGRTYNFVPVQFADGALLQMLLSTSNVVAGRKISDDLLANPAALEDFGLGVGEAPFQIRYRAGVGGLLPKVVRVLQV